MSNLCTRSAPAGGTVTSGVYSSTNIYNSNAVAPQKAYTSGGLIVGNDYYLAVPVGGAFDADALGISCQAFANAQVSVVSLQTALQSMQSQVDTLQGFSDNSPFILDNSSAVALVGATLGIWVIGYVIRQIIQTVRNPESSDHEK